ncbi:MAG: hypothetical protein ACRDJH_07765 [Thermomicrobiales bacterium]
MQIRRTALGLLAALAIMGGVAAPFASAADQSEDTADLTITLSEGGVFALSLSIEAGGNITQPTSAIQPASLPFNVQMRMYLTDTKSYRNAFDLWLNATPYTSNLQVPLESTGTFYQFPDDALKIHSMRNPRPGRCDFASSCSATPQSSFTTPFPIGNIFPMDDDGTVISPYTPTGSGQIAIWTTSNGLDEPRRVTHADAGAGTLNSNHALIMRLSVPAAMPAATYTSTLVVTAIPTTGP